MRPLKVTNEKIANEHLGISDLVFRLKQITVEKKRTISWVAKKSNCSPSQVSVILNNRFSNIELNTIQKIASSLGMAVSFNIEERDSRK